MTDRDYLFFRRLFFWIILVGFLVLTPLIVSFSLGYKMDRGSHKLERTGAISVTSSPKDAAVFLDGAKVSDNTPFMRRGLLPKRYVVLLQKENYYPYQVTLDVPSAMVSELDATLIPRMQHIEKILPSLNVAKFFIIPQLFGKKIFAFTDTGVYETGEGLDNPQKIADLTMDSALIETISGFKENKNLFVFWNQSRIWLMASSKNRDAGPMAPELIFSGGEMIKEIFWGLKGKYLIVHDALRVFVLDVKNPSVTFPIFTLHSTLASIYYDEDSDVLYVRDRLPTTEKFSLFRIPLFEVINEKVAN